jgi:hypothetical protein
MSNTPQPGYTISTGDIVAPGTTTALSEFFGFLGDCGQAAATVFAAMLHGTTPNISDLNAMVWDMINNNLSEKNGAATPKAIQTELQKQGIQTSLLDDWKSALSSWVGKGPVELFLTKAGELPGETPGLEHHFVTVVGVSPSTGKYIVSDPNTPAAKSGKFVLYSAQDLAKAGASQAIVPNSLSGILPDWQSIIDGAGKDLGNSFAQTMLKAFHVTDVLDLVVRTGLVMFGAIMVIAGISILALAHAQNRVAKAAPMISAVSSLAG